MNLSVIIVNYKTATLVIECIDSIHNYAVEGMEIIVVDNDSGDDLQERLRKYPLVQFVQMGYNAGFARANNKGILVSTGTVVLLLNSDTIVLDDALNKCYQKLIGSKYIACGVQLLNLDGSPQISGNYAMRGGLNYLLPLPYIGRFLKGIASVTGAKKPNIPNATGTVEVDWINGAFLMVRRSAINKVGLLDEDFFLYAEEAEWCSRIRKEGPLCIFGEHKVIHLQGGSSNDAFASTGQGYTNLYDKKGLQIMLSNLVRIRKEFGTLWFLFIFAVYLITVPVFFLILLLAKIFFIKPVHYFSEWEQYSNNIFKLIRFLPKIIKNEPYFYKVL